MVKRKLKLLEAAKPVPGIEAGAWVYFPTGDGTMKPGKVIREISRGHRRHMVEVQRPATPRLDVRAVDLKLVPGRKYVVRPEQCRLIPEEMLKKTRAREAAGEDVLRGGSAKDAGAPLETRAPVPPPPALATEEERTMIYEADAGLTLQEAALEALKAGCSKLLYSAEIYKVEILYTQVGEVRQNSRILDGEEGADGKA